MAAIGGGILRAGVCDEVRGAQERLAGLQGSGLEQG
jgi:hypothetical protein